MGRIAIFTAARFFGPPNRRTSRWYLACSRPWVLIAAQAACTSIGFRSVAAFAGTAVGAFPGAHVVAGTQRDPGGELLSARITRFRWGADVDRDNPQPQRRTVRLEPRPPGEVTRAQPGRADHPSPVTSRRRSPHWSPPHRH